jgi:hypothetical protein
MVIPVFKPDLENEYKKFKPYDDSMIRNSKLLTPVPYMPFPATNLLSMPTGMKRNFKINKSI